MNISEDEFFSGVGAEFVKYVKNYDFNKITGYVLIGIFVLQNLNTNDKLNGFINRSIARHLRDFVQNLDNIHHYFGQKFVDMKAPSFFVEAETPKGKKWKSLVILRCDSRNLLIL